MRKTGLIAFDLDGTILDSRKFPASKYFRDKICHYYQWGCSGRFRKRCCVKELFSAEGNST